jgi:glycosyltransferase involved in cell wall biosynthesis
MTSERSPDTPARTVATDHLARAAASGYRVIARHQREAVPLVSAIVPTRNRRGLVAQTVAALLAQDLPDEAFEVIVVDNASDDGTDAMLCGAAEDARVGFAAARMDGDCGPAVARNVGVLLARGRYVAFTDSDCVPTPHWLRRCVDAAANGEAVVQGRTEAAPGDAQPLFNHFIETRTLDGSFSTSNVCYPRAAVAEAGGFDPACRYWEDVDLGWRVRRLGYRVRYEPRALVHHRIMPLSAWHWVTQPRHFYNWPAKAARYPEFRRHLFLGLWAQPAHALFDAAVVGIVLSRWRRASLLLAAPYALDFVRRRRLSGRWPLAKAFAHIAYDCVSFGALLAGSVRYRRPVL